VVDFYELASKEGFTREDAQDALSHLAAKGLVESPWIGDGAGRATITAEGAVAVERSVQPASGTDHLATPVIQQTFLGSVGAVQNAPNSTAHVNQNVGTELRPVLELL